VPRLFVAPRERRPERSPRLVGAFLGTVPGSLERGAAMGRWLGEPLDCQTVFEPWDTRSEEIEAVFERLSAIWDAGRVPILTWEAFTPTPAATPDDVLERAAAGEYDRYFVEWARALAAWAAGPDGELGTDDDRRLYLRPLHEPNGDWYPWAPAGGGFDPETYVSVWRRLRRFVARAGVEDHVNWIWAVNHVDVGKTTAEELFPGDDALDTVGVDGFNWGASRSWSEWRSPEAVFGDMLERVRELSERPVCVPEFATTSATVEGNDPARKGAWLREAFEYLRGEGVVLAAYFDTEKETDWQVFGGSRGANTVRIDGAAYQTYPGFRVGVERFRAP
jgi:hypothetical protein